MGPRCPKSGIRGRCTDSPARDRGQNNINTYCHLKLLSLNVCGLVTKSNYPEFIDLIRNYDIIGIQESKTDDCDFVNKPGYNVYFTSRENLSRRKSGGIVLLVRKELHNFVKIESSHISNLIVWYTISRQLTKTENDVYCDVVYIPPIGSKYASDGQYTELPRRNLKILYE